MTPSALFTRRHFLKSSVAAAGLGRFHTSLAVAESKSRNDRPGVAVIGTGFQADLKRKTGRGIERGKEAARYGDVLAICDVDREAGEYGVKRITEGKAQLYEDYNDVIARDDIDCVIIATPDHWHTKISIDAMRAGKDVYCEKPLTLCVEQGNQIIPAVKRYGRVFQVGTQQRSEYQARFVKAVAMIHDGRIGRVRRVTCGVGSGLGGGPFSISKPPKALNWERWLGPAPLVPYIKERCHWTFRWWYEYSGGKITDWGAHHIDIAQWAIGMNLSSPTSFEGAGSFQVTNDKNGWAVENDGYNTPQNFTVRCQYANDVEMNIVSQGRNGILFEGEKGRFFVNRGTLEGKPVDALKGRPLPEDALDKLWKHQRGGNHMLNFFQCMRTRQQPISDIFSHHRTMTTCHLANICLRLNRKIKWDPQTQTITNDPQATALLKYPQRKGYETT